MLTAGYSIATILLTVSAMTTFADVTGEDPPFYTDKLNLMQFIDAEGALCPVRTVDDWQKRRAHILANTQLVMGPMPDESRKVPLDVQVEEEVALDTCTRKKITFASETDDRVPAYLFIPNRVDGKASGIVCLHQTTPIGKREPSGVDGIRNLHYALELAQEGCVTIAPDYPNYGDYKIDVYARGYVSASIKGIWNHMRAVDVLQSLPEVDPDRIGCIGHSLGGHNTLFLAAFDQRVKVAASSCGFNSFAKYKGGDLAGWSHKGYMPRIAAEYDCDPSRLPFDFTEVLGAIAPRAVFVNAPVGDSNFEISGVHDCLNAAWPVYELYSASDGLVTQHPECGHDFPTEVREAAYGFLDRVLR